MSEFAYDAVRYSNSPYAQTHPGRLATVAIMHGIEPPDPYRARVLEIGCGAGANLLAMAASTPQITAVGVDLAETAVAEARATVAGVGLTNVEFHHADVRTLTDGHLGEFDYVVAHGVYGWVPPDAGDALLETIGRCLSADGLAYVSFNAQPGGYLRRILRDAASWHARDIEALDPWLASVQSFLRFVEDVRVTDGDTWGQLLGREVPALAHAPRYRLVHDDFSEFWTPCWFGDFAEHAERRGLTYVGEADLSSILEMLPGDAETQAWEFAQGDRLRFENLCDLLVGRHFRQSVLTRAGATPSPQPNPAAAPRLHWAVRPHAAPEEPGALADVYATLDRWRPRAVAFDELLASFDGDADALSTALFAGLRRELLIPHAGPFRAATEPGERPRVSALARWQAAHDERITSLVYTSVHMEEPAAQLLITLLDGTRDRAQIRAEFIARTGIEISPEDLEANLVELTRLFLMEPEG